MKSCGQGRDVIGAKLDHSVNVTCAVVASQVVAKNVTQGQFKDERFAFSHDEQAKKEEFSVCGRHQKKIFLCVSAFYCFQFYRARGGEEKKEKQTTARRKIGLNVEN